ncbi:hypothetical protein ACFFMP_18735 [Pseudoroseomonas cervicalis]|uniref:hypothetical protein n=1 Tax=Teichococcus cervicalis TaxID=204525 RepID=UPI0035EB6F8E
MLVNLLADVAGHLALARTPELVVRVCLVPVCHPVVERAPDLRLAVLLPREPDYGDGLDQPLLDHRGHLAPAWTLPVETGREGADVPACLLQRVQPTIERADTRGFLPGRLRDLLQEGEEGHLGNATAEIDALDDGEVRHPLAVEALRVAVRLYENGAPLDLGFH